MDCSPEDCDRIDPDISLTVLQDESIGAGVDEDDEEIEGLRNSLKEMVQDQSVKPKLQCVMMDPSFSMVTVQSEDSGILWETASSRCSSPWASEASTTSEAYSVEGSGPAGKIFFIMDEDKIIRRKKKTRGKLGEKFKRTTSRHAPSEELMDIEERPAMAEVSVPNVRPEILGENKEPTSPKEEKEQDLFSIVSEGYEILNIIVPPRLPTVDEEESSEMAENLSYLEEAQMIKSYPVSEKTETETLTGSSEIIVVGEAKAEEQSSEDKVLVNQGTSHSPLVSRPARKDATGDADYFEKFTLFDEKTPVDLPFQETECTSAKVSEGVEASKQSGSEAPVIFSITDDIEIESDQLDDVFYGGGCHEELVISNPSVGEEKLDEGEPPKSPLKESGSALFGSQENILTPIFLSPGPPKIIDPSLLDEPRAMSFLYTDLYEEAVGDRRKGEEFSDVESTVSERSYQRRLSDTEEASGYLEKFILKDETPVVADEPAKRNHVGGGLREWPGSTSELMGFLTGVQKEAVEDTKPEQVIENFLAPYEESDEIIVASDNTDLEDEVFLPPAIVQESEKNHQGTISDKVPSKDQPEEKMVVKEKETVIRSEESKSVRDETTESKAEDQSNTVDKVSNEVKSVQKTPVLAKESKKGTLKKQAAHTSESQLPHAVSVDTADSLIKGKEKKTGKENSSPFQDRDKSKGTGTRKKAETTAIISEEDKEVQCVLGSTGVTHQPTADRHVVLNTGTQKGGMLRLSPLTPAAPVQEEEEQKVEDDSTMEEEGLPSPPEDFSDNSKDTSITEPPELYRDVSQDEGKAEALDFELTSLLDVSESLATGTESGEVGKAGEQAENNTAVFDFVEVPSQDFPSEVVAEADFEFVKDLDEKPPEEEDKEKKDSKKSRFSFCVVCRCVISSLDTPFSEHRGHEVSTLDKAYDDIKGKLSRWISVLQGRSEKIEDLVSELEQAYNSVEENCKSNAQWLDEQNEEMVRAVVDQFNEMSRSMGEKKKLRLDQLCSQIGMFQERIESAKETLEKKAKEVEGPDQLALLSSSKDINKSLRKALESTLSLEPVLENNTRETVVSEEKILKEIPVPREPHLLPQEANSATCTSITVFWRVNDSDVIDCFQVHCVEESQGAPSEEYKVTVKESYCSVEELAPDKCYRVWVVAMNYAGCSLPSEKLSFRTAPSVPVISLEQCTVCWGSATIRWSSNCPTAADTFTLEHCRQSACEGEGLRSISGIKNCEQSVHLQPNENYLFYIKAVNFAGASEQSEGVLISTRGTRFHLLKDTASPGLVLSKDNVVHYPKEAFNKSTAYNECLGILGELLPAQGHHYWEMRVEGSEGYRIGVAYNSTPPDSRLGENSTSWCIRCIPTVTSCRYKLLHDSTQTDIIVAEAPAMIGILLDYLHGCLSFFNAQSGQLLGSCYHKFTEPCHPVLGLERPGTLALNPVVEVPSFAKRC